MLNPVPVKALAERTDQRYVAAVIGYLMVRAMSGGCFDQLNRLFIAFRRRLFHQRRYTIGQQALGQAAGYGKGGGEQHSIGLLLPQHLVRITVCGGKTR